MTQREQRHQTFSDRYLAFLMARRDNPGINHAGTDPDPADYGVDEWEAGQLRKKVDDDFGRSA